MKTKTALMFAILCVLALMGTIVYGVEKIKSENESASALINKSDAVNAANAVALSTKKDKDNAASNLDTLSQIELNQSEVVPFIELIENTGKGLGVKVKISSVNADPAPKLATSTNAGPVYNQPQTIHIAANGTGSWVANLGFIHALESLPHKVSLDTVTLTYNPPDKLSATGTTTGTGFWQTNVTLTTAIYPN